MGDDAAAIDPAERRVEQARARLDRHLDELGDKLSPKNFVAETVGEFDPRQKIMDVIRRRPQLAGGALALSLGLLLFRLWKRSSTQRA
jgi:hypothetical protein